MLKKHPRIRLAIYLLGLAGAVAAPIIGVAAPDYGTAVTVAAGVLLAAVGVTAATNLGSPKPPASAEPIPLSEQQARTWAGLPASERTQPSGR